jgi:hypothetical protein
MLVNRPLAEGGLVGNLHQSQQSVHAFRIGGAKPVQLLEEVEVRKDG